MSHTPTDEWMSNAKLDTQSVTNFTTEFPPALIGINLLTKSRLSFRWELICCLATGTFHWQQKVDCLCRNVESIAIIYSSRAKLDILHIKTYRIEKFDMISLTDSW